MERFYYLRDSAGKPRVTVCLLKKNDCLVRGIAICSPKDHFSKAIGRAIAYGRAQRVFKNGNRWYDAISRKEAKNILNMVSADFAFAGKAITNFAPTVYEWKLLER